MRFMGFLDYLILAFIGLCVLIVVAIFGMLAFLGIDSVGVKYELTPATVAERTFTPAHTTTRMIMVGKVLVPQTIHHPNSWSIEIRLDGEKVVGCPASQDQYNATHKGDGIEAYVKTGRLSGELYCGGIL